LDNGRQLPFSFFISPSSVHKNVLTTEGYPLLNLIGCPFRKGASNDGERMIENINGGTILTED
jgi:hypothetical protein